MPPINPFDPLNPAAGLTGGLTGGLAGQAWQVVMLGLWQAGLWLLGVVLHLEDALLTPDLDPGGPAGGAYRLTFWLAATLGGVMLLAQLLVTLLRRDARSLGAALLGCGKFVVVWAGWVAWAGAVVAVCGGLTRAVLRSLLGVSSFAGWHPSLRVSPEQVVDTTVATVLGLLGLVLWLAAVGHVLVMLGRAVTLLVLAATTPVAAAGLVGEVGRGWFWRSVRWFHAAALTPLLMALLLGVGVQTTSGVSAGLADGAARAVGTALPGVLLVVTSCFAPVALFRLLSFVDPATPSGGAVRHALASLAQTAMIVGAQQGLPALAGSGSDQTAGQPSGDPSAPGSASDGGAGADGSSGRRDDAEQNLQTSGTSPAPDTGAGPSPAPGGSAAQPTSPGSATGAANPASNGDGTGAADEGWPVAPAGPAPSPPPAPPPSPSPPSSQPTGLGGGPPGAGSSSGGSGSGGAGGAGAGAVAGEAGAVPIVPV